MSARAEPVARAARARARVLARAVARARGALRGLYWYVEGVLGADAYARYLEHHRASGCTSAPMSERQFWRDQFDRQDRQPQGRCC